jgi:hypothetical protein
MDPSSSARPRFHEDPGIDLPEYRALSVVAVIGLIVGLASLVVLVEPGAWWLPLAGLAVSAVAVVRVSRSERLTGRGVALGGLALSVAMSVAVPADRLCYERLIGHEAEQFGYRWFELLGHYEPDRAFELTKHPATRLPPGSPVAKKDAEQQRELDAYLARPIVQKLLGLGDKARVSCERTERQSRFSTYDLATPVYKVVCETGGRTETFQVALHLVRLRLEQTDDTGSPTSVAQWQIRQAEEMQGEPR